MSLLRFILVVAVLGYAGWLAWPLVSPFLEGAAPEAAGARAGATAVLDSGGLMPAALWIAAVVLYVFAALLLGAGNAKAAIAYFLGFLADAALRLALSDGGPLAGSGAGGEFATRSAEIVPASGGLNPVWILLGVLLLIGVLVAIASQRRRRHRVPGHLAA